MKLLIITNETIFFGICQGISIKICGGDFKNSYLIVDYRSLQTEGESFQH